VGRVFESPRGHHRTDTGEQAAIRRLPQDLVATAALVSEGLEDEPAVEQLPKDLPGLNRLPLE
jgi:hypothetical protein